jgi:photosystem II stability/assembly factor-like uncharacterized protein
MRGISVSAALILSILAGPSFAAPPAAAPSVDPALFTGLHWRLIGPFRGGRVAAVAGVPGDPDHFYFGSVGGGVWETKNAGRTWEPIFDDQPVASIGAIAVAPSNPRMVYVGSGEADMRSQISYGNGVYVSEDGGKTWRHGGLDDSQQIGAIAVDPRDANVAFAAVLGHAYAGNATRGVYRTGDGGRTWTRVLFRGEDVGAIAVAIDPARPDTVFAALWQTRRPPWNVYPPSSGPGSGLWRSDDSGRTWKPAGDGLPTEGLGRIGVAFAPSRPGRIYALVDAKAGGMFRSDDGGAKWTRVSGDKRIWNRGWYFGGVTADPKNADVVYACDTAMFRSDDGGGTFRPFRGSPGGDDYHALWIDPSDPRRMIVGSDQGAIVTADGGAAWSSWYNQATAQLYHVTTDDRFPYRVFGAQQDSGAAMVSSRSEWQGITPFDWRPVAVGYENGMIAPDPSDPRTVFGAGVTRFDLDTLQLRDVDPGRAFPDAYRHTWTNPLVFSRRDPKVVYYGNQRVFRTADGGASWTPISPDLSREAPPVPPNLDPVTAADSPVKGPRKGVVYAIAPSYLRDREIWCGTDDGLLWKTADEGAHWTNVTPPAVGPWSKVTGLETSRFDADTVWAAIDRHRLDDFRPHVLRTRDGGRTWSETVAGIPDGAFLQVVREDPVRRGLLYAGTEKGIYVSFDAGDRWQPFRLNLPDCSVRDIVVHGADVVIATHGRSFWILDDVAPLREIAADTARERLRFFSPEPAFRIHPAVFQGTPVPKDEPVAENPPSGAILDYWLGASTPDVALEIRDASGAVVRKFSNADPVKPPDAGKLVVTPDWEKEPPALSGEAGMHRFVWNLHSVTRVELAPPDEDSRETGLWVPPGRYTARLTAGEAAAERTIDVRRDPRIRATDADLAAQFALSREVEKLRLTLASAERRMAAATKAVDALAGKLSGDDERARAELAARLAKVAGTSDFMMISGGGLDLSSLSGVGAILTRLAFTLESADGAPSPDDRRAVEADRALVEKVVAAADPLFSRELPSFNERLRRAGVAPVPTS